MSNTVLVTKSREAHAKQKELARERKASKPNADEIQRAKKLWERLRIKSKVNPEERAKLVKELFDIVLGRVKEFVFKHDSVRPIQCAIKYGNAEQKRMIARELSGSYKELIEGKYSRHMVGKLLEKGDDEIRDVIIPEFYGSIKRLINHPEASWMLDDIYRVKATKAQKAVMLREWYGAEFAITKGKDKNITADLSKILKESPEKRIPVLSFVRQMINQLVQKKLTGFTMLHDALLQYFLQLEPGSTDFNDCTRLIIGDKKEEEEDLLKNLAFTKSGAELVCLVLAHGTAKDRKLVLRSYKDAIELVARDQYGWQVLVTAYEVVDDTRETLQRIFSELVSYGKTEEKQALQQEKILGLSTNLNGRIALLFPFVGPEKWLLSKQEQQDFVKRIRELRTTTSKKEPETRRMELVTPLSPAYIDTVAENASTLVKDAFGCQLIAAVLLSAVGDKTAVVEAVANQTDGDPTTDDHPAKAAHAGRLLRALVAGGHYDAKQKKVVVTAPDLKFADALYTRIQEHVLEWATGDSSFVVVALAEAENFGNRNELLEKLKKGKKALEKSAKGGEGSEKGNAGAKILVGLLDD
jgi:pumilio family protein 6